MHEHPPGLLQQRVQPVERGARIPGLQVDGGAVGAGRPLLLLARSLPHDDERVDTLEPRRVRERLGVVTSRDADHAARLLVRRQGRQLVEDPARLERPGPLQQLRFQVHREPHFARERGR